MLQKLLDHLTDIIIDSYANKTIVKLIVFNSLDTKYVTSVTYFFTLGLIYGKFLYDIKRLDLKKLK